jgi:predicted acetyltransferase
MDFIYRRCIQVLRHLYIGTFNNTISFCAGSYIRNIFLGGKILLDLVLIVNLIHRKSGYESVYRYQHLQYVQLKLPQLKPTEKISKLKISQMSPELLAQLKELYNTYSQRFNGFAVRSDEYWSTWVKTEATNNWIWTNNENKLEA